MKSKPIHQASDSMQVFTPVEVAQHAANKYLGVLVEFPRARSRPGEKKLTTRSLEELTDGAIEYRVLPRRRGQ
jgi:hypothetical protein